MIPWGSRGAGSMSQLTSKAGFTLIPKPESDCAEKAATDWKS